MSRHTSKNFDFTLLPPHLILLYFDPRVFQNIHGVHMEGIGGAHGVYMQCSVSKIIAMLSTIVSCNCGGVLEQVGPSLPELLEMDHSLDE